MAVSTAAGAEIFTEAPRSVITIPWSIIYGRFSEKIRKKSTLPQKIYAY